MEKHEQRLNQEALEKRKAKKVSPTQNKISLVLPYCKGCGLCVDACPSGVLELTDYPESKFGACVKVAAPDYCIGCNLCESKCPDFAIFVNYEGKEK